MVAAITKMTVQEFDRWIELPANRERLFEYVGGEIIEVPSSSKASGYSARILAYIFHYLWKNDIAHVSTEAGGYMVNGERYAPDVAVILRSRQAELSSAAYNPLAPDIAVEVDYPSTLDSQRSLRLKIANYQIAGTTVWLVIPELERVEIYAPNQSPRVLSGDDALDGGAILPDFKLPLKAIFSERLIPPDEAQ